MDEQLVHEVKWINAINHFRCKVAFFDSLSLFFDPIRVFSCVY